MSIDRNTLIVSDKGGKLDIVSEDGELLAAVAVPAGQVSALPYLDLVPSGASLQVSEGLALIQRPHRIGIQRYGEGSHDSGANPDYRPTSASRFEREMRVTISRLQAQEKRVDARLKALVAVERIPKAQADLEVIEPEIIPEAKREASPEAKPADGQ